MSKAKCFKCGASAEADTFKQARVLLDHSIGLARSIKCGDSFGAVVEIKPISPNAKTNQTPPTVTKKEEPKVIETHPSSNIISQNVEPKTKETKTTSRKTKNKKS